MPRKKNRDFYKKAERISFMRRHRIAFRRAIFALAAFMAITVLFSGWRIWELGLAGKTLVALDGKVDNVEYRAAATLGLSLKNVYIQGEKYTSAKEIMQAALLKKNQPIFAVNIHEVKNRIEELDWVESADIERQIPDSLHINITEKKPAAVWQNKGKFALIDDKGEVISTKHIDEFPNLPQVVGEEANSDAGKILSYLKNQPDLAEKVEAIIRVGGRRWNLKLKNNVEILLPEDAGLEQSLAELAELDKKKQLFERKIKSVDLRLPDRVFIKEANG